MTQHVIEILLVEDDPDDADLTMRALREFNLANHIELVADGAAALDFLFSKGAYATRDSTVPKVVLLDLKLPKVNGLEVLREIKSDARTRNVPVVMLTSSNQDRDLKEAYRLGVNSYIVKPVDLKQFIEAARQIGLYWLLLNETP
jgi:CheY-like chemotaxis protein